MPSGTSVIIKVSIHQRRDVIIVNATSIDEMSSMLTLLNIHCTAHITTHSFPNMKFPRRLLLVGPI